MAIMIGSKASKQWPPQPMHALAEYGADESISSKQSHRVTP
jgi:hypothetical protein